MKSLFSLWTIFLFVTTGLLSSVGFAADVSYPPAWAYDAGPIIDEASTCGAQDTSMGCELIRLKASIPYFPAVDRGVMSKNEKGGSNKFRPAYGDIPWRMLQKPNSVKILFIGQDGTHIAEAAGRPATAGFGGRAHDLANYFGVDYSAAFINTYAFTIKGQASSRNTPYLENGQVRFGNIMNNGLWLITQDLDSPIVQWRNRLIDWIIRNNKKSLKLIVGFGGTARESMATYVVSKGGQVGSRYSKEDLQNLQVSETKLAFAGGNNQFPVPLNKRGKDLYADLLGYSPNYKTDRDTGRSEGQDEAMAALKKPENLNKVKENIFLTGGGVKGSGILHPAQIGGYNLDAISVGGQVTRSLKGITLDDGSRLQSDILLVQLPHPTYLSNVKRSQGGEVVSNLVAKAVKVLEPYADAGWKIEKDAFRPELQGKNLFFGPKVDGQRQKYTYGRADIGPEYYDFGTPKNRMVSVSSAKRLKVPSRGSERNKGGVIMFGSRDQPYFDKEVIRDMLEAQPNEKLSIADVWTSRPRIPELLTTFDRGPGEKYAKMMKTNLPGSEIYQYVASHRSAGDFAHYRGTFNNPKVLVVSDPDGYDGLMTARAATGTRGQHLHGLVRDLIVDSEIVNDNYLVLKTLPYGMDGASSQNWQKALQLTRKYREDLLKSLVVDSSQRPKVIITDGEHAKAEVQSILKTAIDSGQLSNVQFVHINKQGLGNASGMDEALNDILSSGNPAVDSLADHVFPANIPRTHLSYYARAWEGTSGDRVLTAPQDGNGKIFVMVAPDWVVDQKPVISDITKVGIKKLQGKLKNNCLPSPTESVVDFLERAASCELSVAQ